MTEAKELPIWVRLEGNKEMRIVRIVDTLFVADLCDRIRDKFGLPSATSLVVHPLAAPLPPETDPKTLDPKMFGQVLDDPQAELAVVLKPTTAGKYEVYAKQAGQPMFISYLESLTDFLGGNMHDGCGPGDPWFIPQDPALIQSIQLQLYADPMKMEGARILVQAPPCSGKTSLLQALLRAELAKKSPGFYPIVLNGGRNEIRDQIRDGQGEKVMALLHDVIERVRLEQSAPIVLFIDDGQHVYPILENLMKLHRGIHLIVAASFYQLPVRDPSTPAVFVTRFGAETISLGVRQIDAMYDRCLSELGLERKTQEDAEIALSLLKGYSRLLAVSDERHHTGLFKYLLRDLKDACMLAATQSKSPSITAALAMKVVSGVSERQWFARVFSVLKSSSTLMSCAGMRECLFELLWNPQFNLSKHETQINLLVKGAIVQLDASNQPMFTTLLVRRRLFKLVDPSLQTNGQYKFSSLDTLLVDAISSISWAEVRRMAENDESTLEIHWAMMLYQRLVDLLSGSKFQVIVEKKSLRRGHMDLFTAVDYIHKKTFKTVNEHHLRLDAGADANKASVGRYAMPEVQDYRIVHFLLPLAASASARQLDNYGLTEHDTLKKEYQDKQITVVPFGEAQYVIWIGHNPRQVVPVRELSNIVGL